MASRAELLSRVRERQTGAGAEVQAAEPLRLILEFERPRPPGDVAAEIGERLGIDVAAQWLSDAHGEAGAGGNDRLARFLAVTVVGVTATEVRDSPFELGYALADATGAVTAEPELGTDFYIVPITDDDPVESTGGPFNCFVDGGKDPTPWQPLWAVSKIKAQQAWELPPRRGGTSRGEGILVFQPDTGVADHLELEDGMIDTSRAYDFVENKCGAIDPLNYRGNPGHGTGTASVVASRVTGVMAGAAPLASLVPLRAVKTVVVLNHGRVAAAVEYARRNGANVITMSLGGPWSSSLRAAMRAAIDDGVIVMAAAGNCVATVVWPARYKEVVAVAGYNIDDEPWIGSCRGSAVDISAPGEFVPRANRAPQNGGSPTDVRGGQGTSFAVALCAGTAALWIGHHGLAAIKASLQGNETVQDRFAALLKATSWRPPTWRKGFGAGIVDARALLEHPLRPAAETGEMITPEGDPLESLCSLLAELAPEAVEAAAAPAGPVASRRYAAELSHLALVKQKRTVAGVGAMERFELATLPSESLARDMALSGQANVLDALR
jgi:serine protease